MKLSIVATLYQSEKYIDEFCRRAAAAAEKIAGQDYEIILVNDGSPDNSLDLAVQACKSDPHIKVLDLSRNFGHHKAMITGLAHACGELVFLIDSDLEEEPEWLPDFHDQMQAENCDVVYGVQTKRKGSWFERWTGSSFYRLFNFLTGMNLPGNIVTARLMKHNYVEALVSHDEREVFIAGLWHITGFKQSQQKIEKKNSSETTYTFRRKASIMINSVTSFSSLPLIGIFYIGLAIFLIACICSAYLVVNWLFLARPMSGWTSLMASIWLLGGMIISFIGTVGIYLSKIYSETKRRPYTIIRQIHGGRDD